MRSAVTSFPTPVSPHKITEMRERATKSTRRARRAAVNAYRREPHLDELAGRECNDRPLGDPSAADASAVRASEIFDRERLADVQLGLLSRDGRGIDLNAALRCAPDRDDAAIEKIERARE